MSVCASLPALHALFTAMVELKAVLDDATDLRDHDTEHPLDIGMPELVDASARDAAEMMVILHVVQRVPWGTVQKRSLAQDADIHEQLNCAVDGSHAPDPASLPRSLRR